jgi:hypothetical protein
VSAIQLSFETRLDELIDVISRQHFAAAGAKIGE